MTHRHIHSADARRASGLSRRGLLRASLGLTGFAGLMAPATGAYAAVEAAHDLVITKYRPVPPGWPDSHRLSITVIADLHAGGPNMGIERVVQVVDAANALGSDLIVILGDYFATHRFVTERVPHPAWAAGAGPPQGAARRPCDPRQSRLVVRHRRRAKRLGRRAHAGHGKRRCPAGRGRPPLLAGRARRSARLQNRTQRISAASTICPARSPASRPPIRSSCWCTSRISSPRCRRASP